MSKRVKIITSVIVAILLVTVATATVMAQEEPEPEAGPKGLLARVADILEIPEEKLTDAFQQAQREMRDEVFDQSLDKAVEEERLTEDEANQIKQWRQQKPEVLDQSQLGCAPARIAPRIHLRQGCRGLGGRIPRLAQ